MNKNTFKDLIPPILLRKFTGLFYGWHGNYSSWQEALNQSEGYDSPDILEKVRDSALKVKNGQEVFERDSVIFDHVEYSFPLLAGLLWIATQKRRLNLLDFGGSLGSSYFQNKSFFDSLPEVNWCIVEQPQFIKAGIEEFENSHLHFLNSINDCFRSYEIDTVLLSSVLQYLQDPYALLSEIILKKPDFIIIDRTPYITGNDRITIQKVHPRIYKGKYPCWFFNEKKFISFLSTEYKLILEFDAFDRANIKSRFKGFLFQRKTAV